MVTMYQTFVALTKGEVISAKSVGFGHVQARAEIMRYINYKLYPESLFSERLIEACEEGKAGALKKQDAKNFDTYWNMYFNEMANIPDGESAKAAAVRHAANSLDAQKIINRRAIERLTLDLRVVPSVEAHRSGARAASEKKEFAAELAREDAKLARQINARESERETIIHNAARDALAAFEQDQKKKREAAEKKEPCLLPDLNFITANGYRELAAFVKRVTELQAQGKPLSTQDRELCQFVSETIVAPFKLPEGTVVSPRVHGPGTRDR